MYSKVIQTYLSLSFFRFFSRVVFFCCWVLEVLSIYWILITYQIFNLQIFSHSVGCFFTLLILSFDAQNVKYSWRPVSLFTLLLPVYFHIQEIIAKSLPNIFSPIFSTKRYIVLVFTFSSLICFEFLYMMLGSDPVLFFSCEYPAPFVEKIVIFISVEWSCHPCRKSFDHICKGLYLDSVLFFVCLYSSTLLFWLL